MTTSELPQFIQSYFQAISAMDFAGAAACFAETCHHEDPVGGPVNATPAQVGQFLNGLGSLFASVTLAPREVHGQGAQWAIAFKGEGGGRNGAAVSFEGIDVIRLDESGHIAELRAYWNPAATIAALTA